MQRHRFTLLLLLFFSFKLLAQKIDRQAVVQRHNVVVTKVDSLSSLSVGNGRFAFTVDATGLQSFPVNYSKGISLGTQSEWGWHSFIDTANYQRSEALKNYRSNGRDISYSVQWNSPQRNKDASNWFRQNPHRLQLGNIGFEIIKKNGRLATIEDIRNIRQELDLWTGEIKSHFTIDDVPVDVLTLCASNADVIGVKISSPLLNEGRIKVKILFPYPTGAWTDEGINYNSEDKHQSALRLNSDSNAIIEHRLDTTSYLVSMQWNNKATIASKSRHYFLLSPASTQKDFELTVQFISGNEIGAPGTKNYLLREIPFDIIKENCESGWSKYWNEGAAIDFEGSSDNRAFELERRIVLSQYLMKVQEAGNFPPQETGLTYNSWFGKPHLEMTWWHAAHWALWGRVEYTEQLLDWYASVASKAKLIAKRQGFTGVRWQKMTDNNGDEAPSSIGALLIWQQPHYIYFAEQCYRYYKDTKTLNKYKELVFATADFMASFAYYDKVKKRYILGKGLIPAQERFKAENTFNPTYELVYWKWALTVAQQWNERLKLPRNKKWDAVIKQLSALPKQDGKYLFAESATDSYTNPEFRTDHPSVLAAFGVMPSTGQVDQTTMKNTFDWIWNNWTWTDTWGWDFPMTAMTAARLGLADKAIDALMMPFKTNTYLVSGHNYQDDRLRLYMPGNGGLLTAIAMMVAGYDGDKKQLPGIPNDGSWKVKWEGFQKMP